MATANMDNSAKRPQEQGAPPPPPPKNNPEPTNNKNADRFKEKPPRGDKNETEEENEEENEPPPKEKIGARSKPKTTMTCEGCKKDVPIFTTECDTSGLAWHSKCFRCKVCKVPLSENTVHIRGEQKNQLFCSSHVKFEEGIQPTCKVYFLMLVARVVF